MRPTTPDRTRWWWQTLACVTLLATVTIVAYWPALTGGFVWDDDTLLTKSELVKAADGLRRIWFTTEPLDYWPMTNSSFWLEWRLWGMHSTGYHVTNLFLHIGSALLLWAILRRLSIPGALLGAFLFALHPVNVESVAWIAQRKNALSMVFFLLSILLYPQDALPPASIELTRATTSSGGKRARKAVAPQPKRSRAGVWYGLSLVAFVLAMLSKGSVVILPGVLLLLIWWRRGTVTRTDVRRLLPFFGVAIVFTLVNIWFQHHLMAGPIRHATAVHRALSAGAILWFYLYKALLPVGLLFVYPQWTIHADDVRWWLPLAAAAATTAILVWQRRRPPLRALLFAWAFFCLALLPVMGFSDVYYMTYSLVADHYQYIAIIGVVTCVAACVTQLTRTRPPVLRAALIGALLVSLGGATWRQSHKYIDAETLYASTLRGNPSSWLIHNLLGVVLVDRSVEEAIPHFREAVRLKPDLVEAHNNLCQAFQQISQFDAAIAECTETLRLNPNIPAAHDNLGASLAAVGQQARARREFEAALTLDEGRASAHNNLANVLGSTGHEAEAIDHYRLAIRAEPDFAVARNNLGHALERQGRVSEAIEQYREAIRLDRNLTETRRHLDALLHDSGRVKDITLYQDALRKHPDQPALHIGLGAALLEAGRLDEAANEYSAAVKALPDSAEAHNGLATALDELGRPAEAETHFRDAIRLKSNFAEAYQNLGTLLQERGRLDEAAAAYTDTLRYDPRSAEAHNNLGVVLVRLGRADEGVAHFRMALQIQPEYADARANLARVLARGKAPRRP